MASRHFPGWTTIVSGIITLLAAGAASAANPAGLYFYDHADATYPNIGDFSAPTALLVTGRCNRLDSHFAQARAAGAEVIAYIDPVDILNTPPGCQSDFFADAALWPYKKADGSDRSEYPNSKLADLRRNSSWSNSVVSYVEGLMREGAVDGVFIDVVGARLWNSLADFSNWSATEQQAWTDGNVDLVRRLNDSRKRINPFFILINNNYWNPQATQPDPSVVYPGEQYVDGIVIQNHLSTEVTATKYAGRTYGSPGAGLDHRRVLAMATTSSDAQGWTTVPGVTHVSLQPANRLDYPDPPIVPPTALNDRPHWFGRVDHGTTTSSGGMTADYKRASKFTLPQNGTLDSLWVYLDGAGATSGTQELRAVLYRDNSGVPGTKVVESNSKWIAAGVPGGWREFIVSHVALTPGTYWIAIFSGATGGVARNYADATKSNWYGNADTFSDNAASPFGSGSTGTVELSVFATYTTP